jgi:hypothetical protein
VEINTPRDIALAVATATYTPIAGSTTQSLGLKPSDHDSSLFLMLAAYTASNEVFPIAQANPSLAFGAAAVPDGSVVTATALDLGDEITREYIKNLAKA